MTSPQTHEAATWCELQPTTSEQASYAGTDFNVGYTNAGLRRYRSGYLGPGPGYHQNLAVVAFVIVICDYGEKIPGFGGNLFLHRA